MTDSNPIEQQVNEQQPIPTAAPVESAVEETKPVDPNSLFADRLAEITTPDGRQKYADVHTALDSIPHAQKHIAEQSAKIKELEEKLSQMQGMETLVEQLKSQQAVPEQPSAVGIDETVVTSLLDKKLQEREQAALAQANSQQVLNTLMERYGDKAEEKFNAQAAALGVSVGFLSDLARKAPKAVLAYFNDSKAPSSNPATGSVNTSVLSGKPQDKPDPMRLFRGSDTELMQKWRAVSQN